MKTKELLAELRKACEEWVGLERRGVAIALEYGPMVKRLKAQVRKDGAKWEEYVKQNLNISARTLSRWVDVSDRRGLLEAWCKRNQSSMADLTLSEVMEILPAKSDKPRGKQKAPPKPSIFKPDDIEDIVDDQGKPKWDGVGEVARTLARPPVIAQDGPREVEPAPEAVEVEVAAVGEETGLVVWAGPMPTEDIPAKEPPEEHDHRDEHAGLYNSVEHVRWAEDLMARYHLNGAAEDLLRLLADLGVKF